MFVTKTLLVDTTDIYPIDLINGKNDQSSGRRRGEPAGNENNHRL